jgi:hypothetical protein
MMLARIAPLLLLAACGDEVTDRGRALVASSTPTAAPDAAATSAAKASRRAAMMSVYYQALVGNQPPPDAEHPPMPLEEAAHVLHDDRSTFAESRRRRAIARLAASDSHDPRTRAALTILEAPLQRIDALLDARTLEQPTTEGLRTDSAAMTGVVQLLDDVLGPSDKQCLRTPPVSKPEWDSKTRIAKSTVTLSVQRVADGLDGFRRAVDPQSWDECSDFIVASYVAEEVNGQYPVNADYNAVEATKPPTPGDSWKGVAFEHLEVTFGVTFSWFKHLLTIDSKSDPAAYRFDFALKKSLRSKVLLDERDGGLDVDDGYALGKLRTDGWIDVEATKSLSFSERPFLTKLLDTWAFVAVAAMGDELWEIVCCVP